ncbi:MAG: SIR2 family protein [Nitrososphaerales archaeon]
MPYVEVQIDLAGRAPEQCTALLRFTRPGSEGVESVYPAGGPAEISLPADQLRDLESDPTAYGRLLTQSLFTDREMSVGLGTAIEAVSQQTQLRLRLNIHPRATRLHSLRWETLRHPTLDQPLALDKNNLLSRYVVSNDSRFEPPLTKSSLSALIAVAAGSDLADWSAAPLDVQAETDRARRSLGNMPVTVLNDSGPVTLDRLAAALVEEPAIVYLVAHGLLLDAGPILLLQGDDGKTKRASGEELVARIQAGRNRPRMIVLASCQSAGTGETPAAGPPAALDRTAGPVALGPRLAETGIAAVVAMQGNVTVASAETFTAELFRRLDLHGVIDLAVAEARDTVRNAADWWSPALFMRYRTGRLWYPTGFGANEFEKWETLVSAIKQGDCTAILGPDLTEPLIGTRREIARRMADTYNFPLSPSEREDLPQVAQYVAIAKDRNLLLKALPKTLFETLAERFTLTPELCDADFDSMRPPEALAALDEALRVAAAEYARRPGALEPHQVLAKLPIPLYITTNPDTLISDALAAANRPATEEVCRWYQNSEAKQVLGEAKPAFLPDRKHPLVYKVFGDLADIDSLVVTEESHFRFLRGIGENRDFVPDSVRSALVSSSLLFLGFRPDDWNFRVLYRGLIEREGQMASENFSHVAAQIDPEQGPIGDAERARKYLETYFQKAHIDIFWGSVEDFLRELQRRM